MKLMIFAASFLAMSGSALACGELVLGEYHGDPIAMVRTEGKQLRCGQGDSEIRGVLTSRILDTGIPMIQQVGARQCTHVPLKEVFVGAAGEVEIRNVRIVDGKTILTAVSGVSVSCETELK